jgi:hypothetical protein
MLSVFPKLECKYQKLENLLPSTWQSVIQQEEVLAKSLSGTSAQTTRSPRGADAGVD